MKHALIASLVLAALPSAALAHDGHGSLATFYTGFAHPFGGFDHLLGGLGISMIAALGSSRFGWPFIFLFAAALGFAFGQIASVGSAFDLVVLPATMLLLLLLWRADLIPQTTALAATAAVGLVHGLVHADVVRGDPGWADFGLGVISAVALMATAGALIGASLRQLVKRPRASHA